MKKILILSNHPDYTYNFRKEIIYQLIEEGYQVIVSSPYGKKIDVLIEEGIIYESIDFDRHGKNPFKDLQLIYLYFKLINQYKPNLILSYTIKPNIYGGLVAQLYNIPYLPNITGIGGALANKGITNLITKYLYTLSIKKAEVTFFQNKANLNFFIQKNIIKQNYKILPGSGVNVEQFLPVNQEKKDDKIRFLFIGRLMKEKGIEEYLEAADSLTQIHNNIEFQILGFFEEDKYKNILKENKNPCIRYLGISSDVRNEIQQVDCVVNPSYHEGMSNVLLESAAMEKPLLASDIPGCKEIIEDGQNGFLFKAQSTELLKNAIIKFIQLNQDEREIMGKKSRKKVVREFDRQIVVDSYLEEIQNILGEE